MECFSYVGRRSLEVEELNVDDEFSGQGNLEGPDEVVVGLELLISDLRMEQRLAVTNRGNNSDNEGNNGRIIPRYVRYLRIQLYQQAPALLH